MITATAFLAGFIIGRYTMLRFIRMAIRTVYAPSQPPRNPVPPSERAARCRHYGIDHLRGGHCWSCNSDVVAPIEARELAERVARVEEIRAMLGDNQRMIPNAVEPGRIGGDQRGPC